MGKPSSLLPTTQPDRLTDEPVEEDTNHSLSRGQILKATLRFNLKLALEGAKDLFLAPLSIAAAMLGLILPSKRAAVPLKFVLRMGHRFDEVINLYAIKELDVVDPRALPATVESSPDTESTELPTS